MNKLLLLFLSCFTVGAQPTVSDACAGAFNNIIVVVPTVGTNPATLANAIVIYDITQQAPSVGQSINLTDQTTHHWDAIKQGTVFATNNASVHELNDTNFWVVAAAASANWKTNFTTQNQPITFYAMARPRTVTGSSQNLFANASSVFQLNNPTPTLSGGTGITGPGQLAVKWYFIEGQLNGASSFLKTNNVTLIPTGNAGVGGLAGLHLDVNNAETQFAQWDIAGMWFFGAAESSATSTGVYTWAKDRFGSQLP